MFDDILDPELTDEEFRYIYCRICVDLQDCRGNYVWHCRNKDPEVLNKYLRGDHV